MRMLQVAAAVFVIFSVLGFQFKYQPDGFSVQFSLLRSFNDQTEPMSSAQFDVFKAEMQVMMDMQSRMAQDQIDARFNAFQIEHDQELTEISHQVDNNISSIDLNNAQVIASLEQNWAQKWNIQRRIK